MYNYEALKSEIIKNLIEKNVIGVVDLKMTNQIEKPISKKEHDIVRFKVLQLYIMECSFHKQQIEIEILNEYNSLSKNIS